MRWRGPRNLLRPARLPHRVLVYRLGSLGDTLVAMPALHLVARAFPQAERRLLTSFPVNAKWAPAATVLEHTGLIHGYIRYTLGTRSVRELLALWWQIVRWRPQVMVYLQETRSAAAAKRNAAFFRLCGIRRIIGVPVTEDMLFPQKDLQSSREAGGGRQLVLEAEASRLVRNLAELGDGRLDDPESWNLHLTQTEQDRATEALFSVAGRPIIAASIGTKVQSKNWGLKNWCDLLTRVAERYPAHALVLCGSLEEAEASALAATGWSKFSKAPIVNLCGALTPRETAAVLARSVVFLGHDSGPMHLAAAVQIPCVAVFSSRNLPRVWFPYGRGHRVLYHDVDCGGCELETCIEQKKKCIMSITVEEVFAAAVSIMSLRPQPVPSGPQG